MSIGANGKQGRRVITRREEDKAMPKNRPRNDRVAVVPHPPDFFAVMRIECADNAAAGTDDLLFAVYGDEERRMKRERLEYGDVAGRFTNQLASVLVPCRQNTHVVVVAS